MVGVKAYTMFLQSRCAFVCDDPTPASPFRQPVSGHSLTAPVAIPAYLIRDRLLQLVSLRFREARNSLQQLRFVQRLISTAYQHRYEQ
jgi:hypothetical protein